MYMQYSRATWVIGFPRAGNLAFCQGRVGQGAHQAGVPPPFLTAVRGAGDVGFTFATTALRREEGGEGRR